MMLDLIHLGLYRDANRGFWYPSGSKSCIEVVAAHLREAHPAMLRITSGCTEAGAMGP